MELMSTGEEKESSVFLCCGNKYSVNDSNILKILIIGCRR
jgi:hypothetical protein